MMAFFLFLIAFPLLVVAERTIGAPILSLLLADQMLRQQRLLRLRIFMWVWTAIWLSVLYQVWVSVSLIIVFAMGLVLYKYGQHRLIVHVSTVIIGGVMLAIFGKWQLEDLFMWTGIAPLFVCIGWLIKLSWLHWKQWQKLLGTVVGLQNA